MMKINDYLKIWVQIVEIVKAINHVMFYNSFLVVVFIA